MSEAAAGLQLSAISHYWDSWVVGYTPDVQVSLLSKYLGDIDQYKIGTIMLAVFFGLLGIIAFFVLRKRAVTPLSEVDREFLSFCRMLDKEGLGRRLGEGPLDYASRIAAERPDLADAADRVARAFVQQNYVADITDDATELRQAIRAFRVKTLSVG